MLLFKTQVHEWYKRFSQGRMSVNDDQHPGTPAENKLLKTLEIQGLLSAQISILLSHNKQQTLISPMGLSRRF